MASLDTQAPAAFLLAVDGAGIPAAIPNTDPTDIVARYFALPPTPTTPAVDSAAEATPSSGHTEVTSPGKPSSENDGDAITLETKPAISTGAALEMEQPSSVVSYHQHAELYLRVRDSAGGFILCKVVSALIAAASPALSDLLDLSKPLKGRDGKLVVEVGGLGNNPYGMDIVLSIIHHKYHDIPNRPDVDQLYSIAQVVEKYDCSHLLVAYMEKWVAGLDWHIVMKKDDNDDDKTLFLTWVFGEARWFARMLSKVAYKATLDGAGVLLDAGGQPWKDQGFPPVILDLITKTRNDCVTKIVRAIEEPLRELMSGDKDNLKFCRTKDANLELKQSCQHLQLGSLMSALATAGLLPFPKASEYRGSVADLAEKVRAIKVARFKLPGVPPHLDGHNNCGIEHEEAVDSAMREDAQLTPEVINQLKLRAQKSGAFSRELFQSLQDTDGMVATTESILKSLRLDALHFKQVVKDSVPALRLSEDDVIVVDVETNGLAA
ncbi:hypothetical protein C8A01DRAFT_38683 [Parachaetomium inaequale]|uniref:Uncharacterized protein n=1 Tax=Parachaetomium inaequale TaxID=2588326 RepID=A0AAN6SP41_9PEZI|nr:hypothetical protein C8A01DRAFT_38683 [Parachaetomium inaequale]